MSSRLIWSFGTAGVVLAAWAVISAISFYNSRRPKRRHRSAERFAKEVGVPLAPEFSDRLARRLRRRGVVEGMFVAPFFAAGTAWFMYHELLLPESEFNPHSVPPVVMLLPLWAVFGLAATAAHFYDRIRESRDGAGTVVQNAQPRLADAVPPILTWAVRATGLLPPLAGAAWLMAPTSIQHGPDAAHPHTALFAVAAITASMSVVAAEAVQRRILRGRLHMAAVQAPALEDVFRVRTMLALLTVPAAVCILTAALIAAPLEWVLGWSGSGFVAFGLAFAIVPLVGLNAAVNATWARRHYLGRLARSSGWIPAIDRGPESEH